MDFEREKDFKIKKDRKRIKKWKEEEMKEEGKIVGIMVEFEERMKMGNDEIGRWKELLIVDVGRDEEKVVGKGEGEVGIES